MITLETKKVYIECDKPFIIVDSRTKTIIGFRYDYPATQLCPEYIIVMSEEEAIKDGFKY